MNDWQKALMIISFWILIQICIRLMEKIEPYNKIYPFWANLIAVLMTFYFILFFFKGFKRIVSDKKLC